MDRKNFNFQKSSFNILCVMKYGNQLLIFNYNYSFSNHILRYSCQTKHYYCKKSLEIDNDVLEISSDQKTDCLTCKFFEISTFLEVYEFIKSFELMKINTTENISNHTALGFLFQPFK